MTIEECLRQFMIDDYGSVKRFAESIGLPPTTVYNVLTRGISGSGFEIVQKIYNTLGLHYTVRGFETDFDYEDLRAKRDEYLNKRNGGFVEVPLLGHIAAGVPIEMDVVEDHILAPREIRRRHPNAFFLTVDGESMNNVLPNGCYALVDPEKKSPRRGWYGVRGLCERLRCDHQAYQATGKWRRAYPRLQGPYLPRSGLR